MVHGLRYIVLTVAKNVFLGFSIRSVSVRSVRYGSVLSNIYDHKKPSSLSGCVYSWKLKPLDICLGVNS